MTTVTLEIAKKAYPLFNGGDCPWYDFVEKELGLTDKTVYGSTATQQERFSFFDQVRDIKTEVRRLYNPMDDVVVGDGATQHGYSDSRAGTVIARTAKSVTIQFDNVKLLNKEQLEFHIGGFSAHCSNQQVQEYSYTRNLEGGTAKFSRRKDGTWRSVGQTHTTNRYNDVSVGRNEFYDYNF